MSIRLRLTLLYSAILALTLILFGSVLYVAQSRSTMDNIRSNLVRQANGYVNGQFRFPGPPDGQSGHEPQPNPPRPSLTEAGGTLPGRWTQTRNINGQVLARTGDLGDYTLPLSARGLQAVQRGTGWFETATVEDQPLLIYSLPFQSQSGVPAVMQVAYPIGLPLQNLAALRFVLIAGSALAIMLAFAAGWVLAGAALRPIERITDTAQAIGAEHDFSHRVDYRGPRDEVGHLALTFNDMLAELESAYRQLQEALDSQRRFVADASHELRTPLTTVRGNMELLRREPPVNSGERAEILTDTTDEVERLIRLVNQLLILARADAGLTPHREPLPVRPLMEDVYRQARLLSPQARLVCETACEAEVLGDRDALKQVLLILVDNALVHTPASASIALEAAPEDGHVALSVRDTGPGISPDVLPHIFERFYRGEVSRTGRSTGLGLAIARELVEAQGGTITVESQLGQGSVFTVTLPRA